MPVYGVSHSADKGQLFAGLGWTEGNEGCENLYRLMGREAEIEYLRLCASPANLLHPSAISPYTWGDILPAAQTAALERMYANASAATRPWFHVQVLNFDRLWLCRWHLWHIFRWRDRRNRKGGTAAKEGQGSGGGGGVAGGGGSGETSQRGSVYDAVRNTTRTR